MDKQYNKQDYIEEKDCITEIDEYNRSEKKVRIKARN